jgi:hypothetical protein
MRLFAVAILSILAVPGASHAAWQAPLAVSSPDADTLAVRVATNVRGDRLVVWERYLDPYNTTVEATAARAGDAYGTPAMLSDPEPKDGDDRPFITTGLNSDPQVAVAPSGTAIAVWVQNSTDGPPFLDRIRAIVLPPGQTTGERVTVSAETPSPSHPGVLFDGAGNATAFWAEQDERVHVAVRPAGGSFGAPDAISNPASTIESPDYAVAANGDAAVVWSSYGRIVAAVGSSGGSFGPGIQLGPTASSALAPKVAMDPQGNALAVWVERQDDYANGEIKVAFRPAGGSFGQPQTAAEVFYSETYEAEVAMSPTGAATIVWRGGALRPQLDAGVTALIRSADGEFGALQRVSSSRPEEAPRVGYDEGGTEYMVWRHYDDQTTLAGRALAVVRPPGVPLGGSVTTISSIGANVWQPDLATGASGHAMVGWPRGRRIMRAEVADHLPGDADQGPPGVGAEPLGAQPAQTGSPSGESGPPNRATAPLGGGPATGPRYGDLRRRVAGDLRRCARLIAGALARGGLSETASRGRLTVPCRILASGRLAADLFAVLDDRGRGRRLLLARASGRTATAGRTVLALRFTRRTALEGRRRVPVMIRLRLQTSQGPRVAVRRVAPIPR